MKKTLFVVIALVVVSLATVYGVNYLKLQAPMNKVLEDDPRNEGVEISVHFGHYMNPSVLTYSIENISGENSRADVFRVFLQFADKVQEMEFETIELAFREDTRFIIEGDYFQELGKEYGVQNPMYTMRTMPENLLNPEGRSAFPGWAGGLLGVLGKQMDDFNSFHDQWYLNDLLLEN